MTDEEHDSLAIQLLTEASRLHSEHLQEIADTNAHRCMVNTAADVMMKRIVHFDGSRKTPACFLLQAIEDRQRSSEPDTYAYDLLGELARRYQTHEPKPDEGTRLSQDPNSEEV